MLSIGKVGGGQASPRYYIDSVASGQEDYYTGHGEAPGQWTGSGAAARSLTGTVESDSFLATLDGGDGAPNRTVLGYDLTFSAPKSVSVLYGIAGRGVSRLVREAHDVAVQQALGYMEREACWTRRGKNGRQHLRGDGLTVAMFRHRTSRAGDPQLHTHSVVANATRAGGRTSALDGRALYTHARTAGYLYQAVLRHELTRTLGIEWEPVHHGVAEVRGIDRAVLQHFSQRSEEIREQLAARGGRTMRSARIATLETRRAKTYNVPIARFREQWRARAAELGLGREELDALLDRRAPGRPIQPNADATSLQLAGGEGVTSQASTFDRRDVLREWAAAHREGARVEDLEQRADEWLTSQAAVQLEHGRGRAPFGGPRFSTPEMLALERDLIEDTRDRRDAGVAVVAAADVERAVEGHPFLTAEQAQLIRELTISGQGVHVVRAAAGTGKTTALAVARDAWERSGVRVYGCALAARAAVELETLAGIDSSTIAQLQLDLDHGHALAHGSVLVVDEAGMVGSRAIAALAEHASVTASKLVLVGDDHQLPELDAGGAFRGLAKRVGCSELRDVRRQEQPWDREALNDLRRGRVREWADAYRDHGRLVARPTSEALRDTLVDDWWETARCGKQDAIMIAHRRIDVEELNLRARERMHRDGRLSDEEVVAGGRAYAIGDKVIARHNHSRLGLVNGSRGEVVRLDQERGTVDISLRGGGTKQVDRSYLDDGWLEHGYALTAHAAQGATVDHAYVLGSDELYREWGYTALSRHRTEAKFYIVSPGSVERALPGLEREQDAVEDDVIRTLSRSRRKELAGEVLERGFGSAVDVSKAVRMAEADVGAARERIRALEEERKRVPAWRRSARAEIDDLLHRQHEALARTESERPAPANAERHLEHRSDPVHERAELRGTLVVDMMDLTTAAQRPSPLSRGEWLRRSVATLDGKAPTPAPDISDTGLEL